jgi:flagellar hook-associated protein 3 FlgL
MRISTSLASQLGINSILDQQAKLLKTQLQLATGKRILTPSDDPSGQTRLLDIHESLETNKQYQDNINAVHSRLSLEEATLTGVTGLLQRVRELAVQGTNATQTAETRKGTAVEVRHLLDEILSFANKQNANGEHIFAGNVVGAAPYTEDPVTPGVFAYRGDTETRSLRISETRLVADSDYGPAVFGPFSSNTGGTSTVNLANLNPSGAGSTFDVTDDWHPAGITIDVSGQSFSSGSEYAAAVELQLAASVPASESGTQVRYVEDVQGVSGHLVFTSSVPAGSVTPTISSIGVSAEIDIGVATQDSAFDALFGFITDMNSNSPDSSAIAEIDLALGRVLETRASVGARLNTIERQESVNADFILDAQTAKSAIEDLDYAEATSRFNLESVGLQAAQQAYVKVQGLSLFNFL